VEQINIRVVTTVDTNDADYISKVTEKSFKSKAEYDKYVTAMNELVNDIMSSKGYRFKEFTKKYDDSIAQALGYDSESEDLASDKEIICETIFPEIEEHWHTLTKIELMIIAETKVFF